VREHGLRGGVTLAREHEQRLRVDGASQPPRGLFGEVGTGHVSLEAAARAAYAGSAVKVDGHMTQLAAEAAGAAMEAPVDHDAAPSASAEGEEHERARAAARAPARLAEGERVHVVVHHGGRARRLGEQPRDRYARELRYVMRLAPHRAPGHVHEA